MSVVNVAKCKGCNNPDSVKVYKMQCSDCQTILYLCTICEYEGYCPICAGDDLNQKIKRTSTNFFSNHKAKLKIFNTLKQIYIE